MVFDAVHDFSLPIFVMECEMELLFSAIDCINLSAMIQKSI